MVYSKDQNLAIDGTHSDASAKADNMQCNHDDFGGDVNASDPEDMSRVDPLAVEKLLSAELNQLSLNRREQVLEEIHGVKTGGGFSLQPMGHVNGRLARREDEDNALREFEEELDRYYFSETNQVAKNLFAGNHNTSTNLNYKYPAYRYAREHGSELINDRDFRLTFFGREEQGSCPKKGAKRMLNYLEFIRQIYDTDDVLFRPICISDLNEELGSREFMYEVAPLQILPIRDPSGRRVFVHLRDFGPSSCPVLVRQQVGMYFLQSMIEDRDGVVFVFFLHNVCHNFYHADEFRNINKLIEIIPPKFSAVHVCCPEGRLFDIAKATITLLIGKENRERLRLHVGSYQECKYALQPFGIPVSRLPIDLQSKGKKSKRKEFDTKFHKKWLGMREAKENEMFAKIGRDSRGRKIKNSINDVGGSFKGVMAAVREIRSKFVECPRHEDCLFGKGRPAMYHPGNIAMRRLLEGKIDRFESMVPMKKSIVVWEVVNEIKRGTGRFLKEDSDHAGVFVITDDATAFKKIAIAFRDLKKRRLRKEEQKGLIITSKEQLSSEDLEQEDQSPPTVRGRKRTAASAVLSSVTPAVGLSAATIASLGLHTNAGTGLSCPLHVGHDNDAVSKQRKRLQKNGI